MNFSLKPFREMRPVPGMDIAGSIGRRGNLLTVRYELRGDLSELAIPARSAVPARRDRLWEDTCLELFLGVKDSGDYWEFNLSPAGHWNAYRFSSYREGMREEPAFAALPFEVRIEPGTLRLSLDLDIGTIIPAGKTVEAAVCAVVRTGTGDISHWALAHPGPRPDFHRRDGFRLALSATRGGRRVISTSSDRN